MKTPPAYLHCITSQVDVYKSIVQNLKQHNKINQSAFYTGTLWKSYDVPYIEFSPVPEEEYEYPATLQWLKTLFEDHEGAKVAVISLGCGACEKEKIVMEQLQKEGYQVPFFGVDTSMELIHRAREAFYRSPVQSCFIQADLGEGYFKKELDRMIGVYDVVIYLFLGNTFISDMLNNPSPKKMTNTLKALIKPGDYMLLNPAGAIKLPHISQNKLLDHYKGYCKNPDARRFLLHPLKVLGISEDCGELTLTIARDDTTGAQVTTFIFRVHTPFRFTLEGEEVILNPNEYIELFCIWFYELESLTVFLEEQNFELKGQVEGAFMNQLLFQKL